MPWRRPRLKKLSGRDFHPKFPGAGGNGTTAPATLLQRPSRQLQEASAAESADRGQNALETASSKKKRPGFSPQISWAWRQWNHGACNMTTKAAKAAAGSFCSGVTCGGPECPGRGLVKKKLSGLDFPPNFLGLEAMETTAPATFLQSRPSGLQQTYAAESADRAQNALATASSKKN